MAPINYPVLLTTATGSPTLSNCERRLGGKWHPPNICDKAKNQTLVFLLWRGKSHTSFCYMAIAWSIHLNVSLVFTGFMQVQQKQKALASFAFLNTISIDVILPTSVETPIQVPVRVMFFFLNCYLKILPVPCDFYHLPLILNQLYILNELSILDAT